VSCDWYELQRADCQTGVCLPTLMLTPQPVHHSNFIMTQHETPKLGAKSTLLERFNALPTYGKYIAGAVLVGLLVVLIFILRTVGLLGLLFIGLVAVSFWVISRFFRRSDNAPTNEVNVDNSSVSPLNGFLTFLLVVITTIVGYQVYQRVFEEYRVPVSEETLTFQLATALKAQVGEMGFYEVKGALWHQYVDEFNVLESNYRYGKKPEDSTALGSFHRYLYLDLMLNHGLNPQVVTQDSFETYMKLSHPTLKNGVFTPKKVWTEHLEVYPFEDRDTTLSK
jgi:hypothetical protein